MPLQREMVGLIKGISVVAKKLGISTEVGKGYRTLANISDDGGQEVPHLHFHLFGGEKVGKNGRVDRRSPKKLFRNKFN